MTVLDQPLQLDEQEAQVLDWRYRCFLAAGAPDQLAMELAFSPVDLHRYTELVKRGCAPETAARILR